MKAWFIASAIGMASILTLASRPVQAANQTTLSAEEQLRQFEDSYTAALNEKDIEAIAGMMTSDMVATFARGRTVSGREELRIADSITSRSHDPLGTAL